MKSLILLSSLVLPNFADPEVLKVNDNLFFLTGTGGRPEAAIPIYESPDLERFSFKRNYNPSQVDPVYHYCDLWAPDLSQRNGSFSLLFSARRVRKGEACPGPHPSEPTTFQASAKDPDLNFGVPELLYNHGLGPRTVLEPGCPYDGCNKAIRIDAERFEDWLFYVWFERGNNISSFRQGDPFASLIDNAGPARFWTAGDEESINEAPSVFKRGSRYYLFYSTGFFNSQYAMHYIMSDHLEGLTRANQVHRHSQAIRNSRGQLMESHGHNSVVERNGVFYNFYHQGVFRADGSYAGRNTHKQILHFRDDGRLHSHNLVNLSWTALPNAEYSIDLITRGGESIPHCVAASRVGRSTSFTYTGVCPTAGDRLVPKGEIAAFRLFWSDDGIWGKHWRDFPYDGFSDSMSFNLFSSQ